MTRSFLDTNVLVYLFDADAPQKKATAQALLEREATRGRAVLSTQVLQEFYVAVTRKLAEPLPPADAEQAVQSLTKLPVTPVSTTMILMAIRRSRRAQLSFWDALIVEAALASGATRLYTEDLQHGQQMDGVEIVNPFL